MGVGYSRYQKMKKMTKKGCCPRKQSKKFGLNKKFLTPIALVFVLAVSGLAAWVISMETTITGNVVSEGDQVVFISSDFQSVGEVNTTISAQTVIRNATITNLNGDLNFTVTFTENITDVDDGCDNTGDLVISYKYEGQTITSGENIIIPSGTSTLEARFDYVRSSCPASVSVTANIDEVVA